MIRTRQQRQADRDWWERRNWQQPERESDMDEVEGFGHAVVLATSIGVMVWLITAALIGWLA